MKHVPELALWVTACFLAAVAGSAWADPPKEPYSPPIGQRAIQGVWNGVEYVYDGDWAPEWLYVKNKDRQVDNPDAFERPGDYRDQSRPGYRARPTPQSVAYYRYVMDKIGRGEDINVSESIIIRKMIQNRTWPEAPTLSEIDRRALDWADKQSDSEDASIFTDPEGWTRKKNADLIYENMTSRGCTEEDTPASEGIEKFREYWQAKTPEEKKALPLGRWMKNYLVRKGFDMRSDEERADDDAYGAKQEENRQKAEAAKTEAERQAEEKVQQEAERQKDWFKEKWEEEDRRTAEKEAIERLEQKIEESKRDEEPSAEPDTTEDEVTPDTEDKPEEPPAEPDTPENEVEPEDEAQPENEIDGEEVTADEQPVPPAPPTREREGKPEVAPEPENAQGEDIEPEDYPDKQPEAGDTVDSSDGSSTTTKGWVQGSDGSRVTLTETRNPDGSVTTTTTETDPDGNVISQTSYGESGEGRTTTPGGGLRGAEAESDAEVDSDMATDGYKAADSYSANWTDTQDQRGTDGSMTMAQNAQMQESSNIGNQDLWNARATRDTGGRDAQFTADAARQKSSKADRENSWGKAIGDGVESGITEGGKAFGQAMGQGAADRAIGEIFGPDKDASDSAGASVGGAASAPSASAALAGSSSSGSGKKKPSAKTKPTGQSKPSGSSSGSSPSASSGNSQASSKPETAGNSSPPLIGHCPKCGRTDLVEHVYDRPGVTVHDWRCPVCDITGRPGPPPPGLGTGSGSASGTASAAAPPAISTPPTPAPSPPPPAPKKTRKGCPACKAPVTFHCNSSYGAVYKCDNGHFVKGNSLVTVEIE